MKHFPYEICNINFSLSTNAAHLLGIFRIYLLQIYSKCCSRFHNSNMLLALFHSLAAATKQYACFQGNLGLHPSADIYNPLLATITVLVKYHGSVFLPPEILPDPLISSTIFNLKHQHGVSLDVAQPAERYVHFISDSEQFSVSCGDLGHSCTKHSGN